MIARLSSERFFRQQFGSIFSEGHPLTDEEAADQWCLIAHDGGARIGHRLIAYMDEREAAPNAGTARSATGRSRSASPGGWWTRSRP